MQFEQTKSNEKLDSYTLLNSLPIQVYKIVSNSNEIISYQIEIDTVKQINCHIHQQETRLNLYENNRIIFGFDITILT
jgi:hypothetical protein